MILGRLLQREKPKTLAKTTIYGLSLMLLPILSVLAKDVGYYLPAFGIATQVKKKSYEIPVLDEKSMLSHQVQVMHSLLDWETLHDLKDKAWDTWNSKDPDILEFGIFGCRSQYYAVEGQFIRKRVPLDLYDLFLSLTFKACLPLSTSHKLYVKYGKLLQLNPRDKPYTNLLDLKDLWKETYQSTSGSSAKKDSWQDLITLVGIGLLQELTSRIEIDICLLEGQINNSMDECRFSTSVSVNYLL